MNMSPLGRESTITGSQRSRCPLASSQSPRWPLSPRVFKSFPSGLIFFTVPAASSQIQTLSSLSTLIPCALTWCVITSWPMLSRSLWPGVSRPPGLPLSSSNDSPVGDT